MALGASLTRKEFINSFDHRLVNIKHLSGETRKIAGQVNSANDSTIRSEEELSKLFDLLDARDTDGKAGVLTLRDESGALTPIGKHVDVLIKKSESLKDLFETPMLQVRITGWPAEKMSPASLADILQFPSTQLSVYSTNPQSNLHIAPPEADGILFATGKFSVRTSGNFTNGTPKSSYKINFETKGDTLDGMKRLNLKSMWNDVSQMREAIAWDLFDAAGVAAPKHTYAKFAINNRYYGLYSLVEQIEKPFLKDHFGKNDEGNLYKAYWSDIGPADLKYRTGADGDDSGKQYFKASDIDSRSYRLKTNEDDPASANYNDLAELIKVINGIGLPGTGDVKFNTPEYKKALESVFDVKGFLRWASTNVLLGAWDNYWATPANYYLYNSGKKGGEKDFMEKPYFHFIPWDYDNSLGIDFFNTQWQNADILNPAAATKNYGKGKQTEIPLLTNILKNDDFRRYYLDHLEHMLDTSFNPEAIGKKTDALWKRISPAAFLESDTAHGPSHTGRQFTNHEVWQHGSQHWELHKNGGKIDGIAHYVRMRHDSARAQLQQLRETYPKGSSGATFDGKLDKLPSV